MIIFPCHSLILSRNRPNGFFNQDKPTPTARMKLLLVAVFLGLVALSVGEGDADSQGITKARIESCGG
jgi:hypothetical protein